MLGKLVLLLGTLLLDIVDSLLTFSLVRQLLYLLLRDNDVWVLQFRVVSTTRVLDVHEVVFLEAVFGILLLVVNVSPSLHIYRVPTVSLMN